MDLVNKSPFLLAPLVGRLNFPGHSLTLIVKGTFYLKEGQIVELAEEQLYPGADEFYPGDDEMQGGPRYEMDFACLKPKADLLLVGKCHAPGKDPVKACRVTFRVGSKSRSLAIFGKRSWKHDVMGLGAISEPRPFRTMELRYEKSYGGEEYKKNPVGKGYSRSLDTVGIKGRYLPNIEDPDNLIESSGSHPQPAGFGPLNRMWALRHSKMGTYKGKYQKERWPWFPEDFDYSHFNAAPPEMQLEGYLRGDEELYFENLHKKHSQYSSRLPGVKVRAFINKLVDTKSEETVFTEVPLNLDTLWVDMEAGKLVLVWRSWSEVLSEEYEEVQHIYLMSEKLEEKPKTLPQCQSLFAAALAEEQEEPDLITDEPDATRLPGEIPVLPEDDRTILAVPVLADAAETQPDIPELAEEEKAEPEIDLPEEEPEDKAALLKKIEAQTAAIMAQFGLNIESLPAEMSQKMKEEQQRILKKLTEEDPQKLMEMEQEEREKQMQDALSELGIDPDNLPPLSEKAKSEQERLMQELGLTDKSVLEDSDLAKYWQMLGAVLPKAGVDPENLEPLIEKAKPFMDQIKEQTGLEAGEESGTDIDEKAAELEDLERDAAGETAEIPELEGEEGPDVKPSREQLEQKIAGSKSLAGMDLSGVDLSGLQMPGADFSGAILAGAVLTGVNLAGANLSGTTLNGADLSQANLEKSDLKEADLSEGNLSGANLSGAQLNDTVFEKAKMNQAKLDEAEAKDTIFTEADLSGSSFKNAQLSGADLSNCVLEGADFQAANLSEANLEGARGQKINFQEADLTKLRASEKCDFSEGIFVKAKGLESIWQEANLNGADFSFSHMEGADFGKASLQQANLSAANMKFSRFVKANLKEAKMLLMNLFEGSLEKADLSRADLSGANLYAVEFLEAILENTLLNRANLKKTKLEKK